MRGKRDENGYTKTERRLLKAKARRSYKRLIDPIRRAARRAGYAIAVHGSISRDIDLVAIPWIPKAEPQKKLVEAVRRVSKGHLHVRMSEPSGATQKPHGRRAYIIYLIDGSHPRTYIDLSVMPRSK